MLLHLSIKDFAIIDSVSLDFHQGFLIFTGETGAGKSILIEAISLALGARADTAYVRSGKDKAIIELTASTTDPAILCQLRENGIDTEQAGEEVILTITREVQAEGRSTCRVNGTLVAVSFVAKLCRQLADIHGQYDHQSLLDPDQHLCLLDSYGGKELSPLLSQVSDDYHAYAQAKQKLDSLLKNKAESERKRDFMQFELTELLAAELIPQEDTDLSERLILMQNSELLFSRLTEAYGYLYEEHGEGLSASDLVSRSSHLLTEAGTHSKEISAYAQELTDCFYRLEALQSELRNAKDKISFSPDEIDRTVERLELLTKLKRKYGPTLEEVMTYRDRIAESLSLIEEADHLTETLTLALKQQKETLSVSCSELSAMRKKIALEMESRISKELAELHFQDARLFVQFMEEGSSAIPFSETGTDRIEFLLITNKGEVPKPLAKIASGGEISRIMLAFKSITGDFSGIPTMIFDEIDSGISGITASVVGRKLRALSKNHQILCITHLAQIAACSDHHYRITKEDTGERTESKVIALGQTEKELEIARLLGGMSITEATLQNARELINEATQ